MTHPSAPHIILEIDFTTTGNSKAFTIDGWSDPEAAFTWATGETSSLVLVDAPAETEMCLELLVAPLVFESAVPAQRLSVSVNGHFLLEVTMRERGSVTVPIPPWAVRPNEALILTFRHPDGKRPVDFNPNNGDTRVLSIAFIKAMLRSTTPVQSGTTRRGPSDKYNCIMYGNCQMEPIAATLNRCETVARYVRSYSFNNFPGRDGRKPIPFELKERCGLFIHQVGEWGRHSIEMEGLNKNAVIIHVPPVGSNALWPLKQAWPKLDPTIKRQFELDFEYSDRIAIKLALSRKSKAIFVDEYWNTDISNVTDVLRIHELDLNWIRSNEAMSDVRISDFIEENFAARRLFWSGGHLSNCVYLEFMKRLANRLADADLHPFSMSRHAVLAEIEQAFEGPEVHAEYQVPVHPQTAAIMQLQWYEPNYIYENRGLPPWTFPEFIEFIYDYLHSGEIPRA